MDIQNYLRSLDIDYRLWSRRVTELELKGELNDAEKQELDNLKKLMKAKEEEITLRR